MGAVDTMEDFFEKLNDGDRQGAVALMDERVEMRIHVGDNARTLRGVEQVGGGLAGSEPCWGRRSAGGSSAQSRG